ncbi:MAG: hypothetical protein AAFQ19_14125 [Pseudomonadota bacterium]
MFNAFLVPHAQALALDDDFWVSAGEKGLVLDQVVPNICPIRFDHPADVVFVERSVHGISPFECWETQ